MSQIIVRGREMLSSVLNKYNKIFFVHGKSFENNCLRSEFDTINKVEFNRFSPNPLYEDVCEGVKLFNDNECDAIVVVGGGSAIDVAKCIKLFSKLNHNKNYIEQEKKDLKIPLIAVPTTAGTGSESTKYAVIYYCGEKQSISNENIVPDYVILIPEVLKGLPVYQKKCAMLDALCQSIESWWSVNSTQESKEYSKKAIIIIRSVWKEYIQKNTIESCKDMLEAANYAGQAINITATTAAHAMSYKITSLYSLPHGHAVALCMAEVWDYMRNNIKKCDNKDETARLKSSLDEIESIISFSWFQNLLIKLDMKYPKSKDKQHDIVVLANSVNQTRLKNNPIKLTVDVLTKMYKRIIKE